MARQLLASLAAFVLAAVVGVVDAASQGNITLNSSQRFLFDVNGDHISTYALKIYCTSPPSSMKPSSSHDECQ